MKADKLNFLSPNKIHHILWLRIIWINTIRLPHNLICFFFIFKSILYVCVAIIQIKFLAWVTLSKHPFILIAFRLHVYMLMKVDICHRFYYRYFPNSNHLPPAVCLHETSKFIVINCHISLIINKKSQFCTTLLTVFQSVFVTNNLR